MAFSSDSLHAKQQEVLELLKGPQRHMMLVGGARSGKTFLLCVVIMIRALKAPNSRHGIFRFRGNSVWASIGLDTLPKVARLMGVPLKSNKVERFYTLPNGSEIWLAGLDDKQRVEKILGLEFVTVYENEASQIPYSSHLVLKTRLAQVCPGLTQRHFVDLNPAGTAHWAHRLFVQKIDPDTRKAIADGDDYVHATINPKDNAKNLDPAFLKSLENLPERQRRRFYDGVFSDEIDGALWPLDVIAKCRWDGPLPHMQRIVVAVDPSGARGPDDTRSDMIGIAVVGLGDDGICYVLADLTCRLAPAGWARVTITAFSEYLADCVIGERNFGGAMVEHTIRSADPDVPYHEVVASRGKAVRAEPVSTLYAKDKVRHVGYFPELEDEMENFSSAGYLGDKSPNRVDAVVWGVTYLVLADQPMGMALFELERQAAAERDRNA